MRVSDLVAIAGNLTPEVYYDRANSALLRHGSSQARVQRYRFNLQEALHSTQPQ